jgi:hypothetical protein
MATKIEKKYVVKKASKSRDGKRTFWNEIGRLTIRESDEGKVTGSLRLHMIDGDYAVFPVEPKENQSEAGE